MSGQQKSLSVFIQELRNRRVFRTAAVYLGSAFVTLEAADMILPRLGLPDWTVSMVLGLLMLGFPVVVALAWSFQLTEEGLKRSPKSGEKPSSIKSPLTSNAIIAVLLIVIAGLLIYPRFIGDEVNQATNVMYNQSETKSVVVLPFENLTGDEAYDVWSKGMGRLMTTKLSGSDELYVLDSQAGFEILDGLTRDRETVIQAGLNLEAMQIIGQRAQVENLILGEILKAGGHLRLSVRVVVAESGEVRFATQATGDTEDDLFSMAEALSQAIQDYLEIEVLEKDLVPDFVLGFTSAQAYRLYLDAMELWISARPDFEEARILLEQAWQLDPQPSIAAYLIILYHGQQMPDSLASIRAQVEPMLPDLLLTQRHEIMHSIAYSEKDYAKAAGHLEVFLSRQPSNRGYWFNLGIFRSYMGQWEKSAKACENTLELSRRWNSPFTYRYLYTNLAYAYHQLGRHQEESAICLEALALWPDMAIFYRLLGSTYLELGRESEATQALALMDSLLGQYEGSTSIRFRRRGAAFERAGFLDSAQVYYESAFTADSGDANNLYALAYLLIDQDLDIDRGVTLIEKAVALMPDNENILNTYGWGLYKQGHNKQALEVLEKAYKLAIAVDYISSQHLSIVREAVGHN